MLNDYTKHLITISTSYRLWNILIDFQHQTCILSLKERWTNNRKGTQLNPGGKRTKKRKKKQVSTSLPLPSPCNCYYLLVEYNIYQYIKFGFLVIAERYVSTVSSNNWDHEGFQVSTPERNVFIHSQTTDVVRLCTFVI